MTAFLLTTSKYAQKNTNIKHKHIYRNFAWLSLANTSGLYLNVTFCSLFLDLQSRLNTPFRLIFNFALLHSTDKNSKQWGNIYVTVFKEYEIYCTCLVDKLQLQLLGWSLAMANLN